MEKLKINSHFQLSELLETKFEGQIEIDKLKLLLGGLKGKYKGKIFIITFKSDECLLISFENGCEEQLNDFIPVLNQVMGEAPICCYNMQTDIKEKNVTLITYEWEIKDREKRVKDLVNNRGYESGKLTNFYLLGNGIFENKTAKDFLETEEEKQERMKNAKIYGIYPAFLDEKQISGFTEKQIFEAIEHIGSIMFCAWHATKRDPKPCDLTEEQYAIEYLVYQTRKFGVELPEAQMDKHVRKTESYNEWYLFWRENYELAMKNPNLSFMEHKSKSVPQKTKRAN